MRGADGVAKGCRCVISVIFSPKLRTPPLPPNSKAHLAAACHLPSSSWGSCTAPPGLSSGLSSGTVSSGHSSSGTTATPGRVATSPAVSPLSVFRWLCRIAVNGVALRPLLSSPAGGERYGVAMYAALSLLNHSCRPNATLRQASPKQCLCGAIAWSFG